MIENYSFFVEHPLRRVLVVPSASYSPGAFDGLKAGVVMWGIGTLGKQTEEFAETYWRETVRKSGAKLVLPSCALRRLHVVAP